jgi:GH35 family endo-1,4-beta-xylanase
MDVFGKSIQVDWFNAARAALPSAALFLNDFNIEDQVRFAKQVQLFEDTVRYLLQHGAPLTGLGVQGHINSVYPGIPDCLATFDRYAAFGLPIRITEFDVNTTDLALQTDYTRDFLIMVFSHPSVIGVQHWGFWESAHWRPAGAMYRADWSEKPNAKVYKSLVLDQWRTNLETRTGDDGLCHVRGFHGDYVVTVEANGRRAEQQFSVPAGLESATVVSVVLP